MKNSRCKVFILLATTLFLLATVIAFDAHARVGGGGSFGSRGSRSYSRPAAPSTQPSPYRQVQPGGTGAPSPYQQPQPAGGGFLRSLAGGMLGGFLGGMLFRSLGFGGMGGMGGSGIGLFEIILLAGIGYMIYRMVKRRRESAPTYQESAFRSSYDQGGSQWGAASPGSAPAQQYEPETGDVEAGLAHVRQMDPSFDEIRFADAVMDLFFKIQGAWMNRDLASATPLLTDEMKGLLQKDVDRMVREKQVNRLENIAVRNVEIAEAWQEAGQDYITALIYANLLDYTTDDTTGAVVAGSKTEPVKFEEYWTFTRPVGNNPWRLSAIQQKD